MRLKHLLFLLLIIRTCSVTQAKEAFYPVSEINPLLLLNSNAVVRNSEVVLEIYSEKKVSYRVKKIITVLNENGDGEGVLYIPYDSNRNVDIKEAVVYDKNGRFIKKFKNTDIYDQRYFDGFSLFNDLRFKRITPNVNTYPYTVHYEYSLNFNGIVDYYDWLPVDSYSKSIEYASYSIILHDNMQEELGRTIQKPLIKAN